VGWLRESVSDSDGSADIAYISIAGLVLVLIGTVIFLCAMSAIAYARCDVITDVGQGVRAAIPCPYDPNPLGLAIAACLGAFGSPIGALALYMAQTRRQPAQRPPPTTTTVTATATMTDEPAKGKPGYQGD
jgi:hypothetical protein